MKVLVMHWWFSDDTQHGDTGGQTTATGTFTYCVAHKPQDHNVGEIIVHNELSVFIYTLWSAEVMH